MLVYSADGGEVRVYNFAEKKDHLLYEDPDSDARLFPRWGAADRSEIDLAGPVPMILDRRGEILWKGKRHPEWWFVSPNGDWLLTLRSLRSNADITTWELVLRGSRDAWLVDGRVEFDFSPPLWLDEERFLWRRNGRNYVQSVHERAEPRDIGNSAFFFSDVHRASGRLAGTDGHRVIAMDTTMYDTQPLFSSELRISRGLTWSPDGEALVFCLQRQRFHEIYNIYVHDLKESRNYVLQARTVYWWGDWE